jgi:hypothetical protein
MTEIDKLKLKIEAARKSAHNSPREGDFNGRAVTMTFARDAELFFELKRKLALLEEKP